MRGRRPLGGIAHADGVDMRVENQVFLALSNAAEQAPEPVHAEIFHSRLGAELLQQFDPFLFRAAERGHADDLSQVLGGIVAVCGGFFQYVLGINAHVVPLYRAFSVKDNP